MGANYSQSRGFLTKEFDLPAFTSTAEPVQFNFPSSGTVVAASAPTVNMIVSSVDNEGNPKLTLKNIMCRVGRTVVANGSEVDVTSYSQVYLKIDHAGTAAPSLSVVGSGEANSDSVTYIKLYDLKDNAIELDYRGMPQVQLYE